MNVFLMIEENYDFNNPVPDMFSGEVGDLFS